MSIYKIILLSALLAIPLCVAAQPGVELLVAYDMVGSEQILDVYTLADGGYALCGSTTEGAMSRPTRGDPIVIRTDAGGNEVWSTKIELAGNDAFASSIIQADNGDFVCGGFNEGRFCAFRLSPDGDLLWIRDYWNGKCWGIIELKNGDFILVGDHDGGCLVRIDAEGEPIWQRTYTPGWLGHLNSLRETNDGVVASGYGMASNNTNPSPWVVKVRLADGEPIWTRLYRNEALTSYVCFGMTSSGDGGFALAGTSINTLETSGEDFFVLRIDRTGEQQWINSYPREKFQYGRAITRLSDGGFAIVGESSRFGPPFNDPCVIRIDPQGEVRWECFYRMQDSQRFGKGSNMFWGITTGLSDEIIGVGAVKNAISGNYDGFLMKLEPDLPNAAYLEFTPEDTIFSVLPGTTVSFMAKPRGRDPLEYEYLWTFRDTVRSADTICDITFDALGEEIVSCVVSQGDVGTTIRWRVNVTDLYIYSFTPDTLNLRIRRNASVGFAIDSVASTELVGCNYLWSVTNVENFQREELDSAANTTVAFHRAGQFMVEGSAYRGDLRDNVRWNVQVVSPIRDYWPSALFFGSPYDSVVTFGIDPFDPGSPNLRFRWFSDTLEISDSSTAELHFNVAGLHSIQVFVTDSLAGDSVLYADTLLWVVRVEPENDVADPVNLIPLSVGLSLNPNPFNAQTTVKYAIPTAGPVKLTVFDLAGREVATLLNSVRTPGRYSIVWNAAELPAGIYMMKMETNTSTLVTKGVVLK